MERAARREVDEVERFCRSRGEWLATRPPLGREQQPAVRVARLREHISTLSGLYDATSVHDGDAVAGGRYRFHVVADDQHRENAAESLQGLERLRFDGAVERGCGLVCYEQPRCIRSAIAISTRCRIPPESWCG